MSLNVCPYFRDDFNYSTNDRLIPLDDSSNPLFNRWNLLISDPMIVTMCGLDSQIELHHSQTVKSLSYLMEPQVVPTTIGNGEIFFEMTYKTELLPEGAVLHIGLNQCSLVLTRDYAYFVIYADYYCVEHVKPIFDKWVVLKIILDKNQITFDYDEEQIHFGNLSSLIPIHPSILLMHNGLSNEYHLYLDQVLFRQACP